MFRKKEKKFWALLLGLYGTRKGEHRKEKANVEFK